MSDTKDRFMAAVDAVQGLEQRPDEETLLQLYAFYKQGTMGDVSGDKPGMFDFVGMTKWEAWASLQGMPRDEARRQYTDLVISLGGKVE